MLQGKRWVPASLILAGLMVTGVAVVPPVAAQPSQKLHLAPPGGGGGGKGGAAPAPQSQKLHLTPPNLRGAPQQRQVQPAPRRAPAPPAQAQRPPQTMPGAQQPSQKLHLTPPTPRGPRPGTRNPNEREAQRTQPPAEQRQQARPAPSWPALPPRMANEPAALERLRGLFADNVEIGYREARQDGEVLTLVDVDLRRDADRILVEELILDTPSAEGLRRGEARNIQIQVDDGRVNIAQLDIAGLVMLALRPGQDASDRDPDQITLESLNFAGLEVVVEDTRVTMARFELAGWRLGQSGRMAMEALDVRLGDDMPVDQIRVARAGLQGLDLAAMMTAATQDSAPPPPPAGQQAYRLEGFEVLRDGQSIGGMGRFMLEGQTAADGGAAGRISFNDVVIERTPETAIVLDAVNLDRLSMDLTIDASWTPANERLELSALAFGVRDLGALALGWTVEGLNPASASPDPAAIRLFEARLRYADESLYERALADQGRRQNMTPMQVRQEHAQMVNAVLTGAQPDAGLDAIRTALLSFVQGQAREIEFQVRPPAPITMAQVEPVLERGPAAVVALLGITATAR